MEILRPEKNNEIIYRIYFYHNSKGIYDKLKERLEEQRFVFPPYMGVTEFLASVDYIAEGQVSRNPQQEVELNSVCKLNEVELDFSGKEDLQYITEKMPTGFLNDRTPRKPEEYVLELKGKLMKVKLKNDAACYSVNYSKDGCRLIENVMFM
jgi:CRISPR-associated protein Cas5h